MKSTLGASSLFYLLIGIAFVVVMFSTPYPHYNTQTKSWYLGASLGSRITGNNDKEGIALDSLVWQVSRASVTSPLELTCNQDSDCKEYQVANQCKIYCGNLTEGNISAVAKLNNNRVCDPAMWNKQILNCQCISGRCISLK